jgi:hypothetical protein
MEKYDVILLLHITLIMYICIDKRVNHLPSNFSRRLLFMKPCIPSRIIALLLIVLCAVASLSAQSTIESFLARSDGRAITIEWRSAQEAGISLYEIERSPVNQTDFKRIGSVPARGAQQAYRFIDENALVASTNGGSGSVQSGSVYVYRLKIIDVNDKATYSNTISVSHTISSVRRTWGMIKEMFR